MEKVCDEEKEFCCDIFLRNNVWTDDSIMNAWQSIKLSHFKISAQPTNQIDFMKAIYKYMTNTSHIIGKIHAKGQYHCNFKLKSMLIIKTTHIVLIVGNRKMDAECGCTFDTNYTYEINEDKKLINAFNKQKDNKKWLSSVCPSRIGIFQDTYNLLNMFSKINDHIRDSCLNSDVEEVYCEETTYKFYKKIKKTQTKATRGCFV